MIGIAQNTSPYLPYECLIPSSAEPEELHDFAGIVGGDTRLLLSRQTTLAGLSNLAANEARGRYLCFLPFGMVPQEGWLPALLREIETKKETGIVGGRVVFADGLLAHAGIAFDPNLNPSPLYRLLPATFAGANRVRTMRAVTGCLLVRREAFTAAGGFDEGFIRGWHDIDLCLQAALAGWQTLYTPHSLFLALRKEEQSEEEDRLRFHAKWVGHVWPDEEEYWKEDGLDNQSLSNLYQQSISNYGGRHDANSPADASVNGFD